MPSTPTAAQFIEADPPPFTFDGLVGRGDGTSLVRFRRADGREIRLTLSELATTPRVLDVFCDSDWLLRHFPEKHPVRVGNRVEARTVGIDAFRAGAWLRRLTSSDRIGQPEMQAPREEAKPRPGSVSDWVRAVRKAWPISAVVGKPR
nr:hypothetical protein [uncultured Rhodopila sp.]